MFESISILALRITTQRGFNYGWKTVERRNIERTHTYTYQRRLEKKLGSRRDKEEGLRREEGVGRRRWGECSAMKKWGSRGPRGLGCSWCSTGANCPFYYSAGCKSPAKFDAWLTARGKGRGNRGKADGRGRVSVSTQFPHAFSSRLSSLFPADFTSTVPPSSSLPCSTSSTERTVRVIDENNRSPPDFPLVSSWIGRNKWILRSATNVYNAWLNSEWSVGASREFVDSCLVRFRVFSCLFELPPFDWSLDRKLIGQSRNREQWIFAIFYSICTYSSNGTIDE